MPTIASSWSTSKDANLAISEVKSNLLNELGNEPNLLIVYVTHLHEKDVVREGLKQAFPEAQIHGGTSCIGLMTNDGFHSREGYGLGLFGIYDPEGDYGVGGARVEDSPRQAGAEAIESAIENANREGELPELVWINGVPGAEEEILLGIQDVIGENVPIAGGSTADNTVSGQWYQFTQEAEYVDAVIVTAMYPSVKTHIAFHSGYSPTEFTGRVTRAEGRLLQEINGRPAAAVYNEWTGGLVNPFLDGGNVLATTTLHPLARYVDHIGGVDYHRLSHPETITHDGAMTLFTSIEEGEELILMAGTRQSLISRAGRVAQSALEIGNITADDISGALVIYCAGCMLTVQDGMHDVAMGVKQSLNNAPFIGTFTFGEQGCFLNGDNYHGNLMISVVVFEK